MSQKSFGLQLRFPWSSSTFSLSRVTFVFFRRRRCWQGLIPAAPRSEDGCPPRSADVVVRAAKNPSSVLAPSSDALVSTSFLLLVVRPLLLVAMPGAPSSVLASKNSPSSHALCS